MPQKTNDVVQVEGVQSSNNSEKLSLSGLTPTNALATHGMMIVKREMFNPNVMNAILAHTGISIDDKKRLQQYYKRRINGNVVEVKYDYPKGNKEKGDGRVYAEKGLSLQMFPCDVRNALAKDYYWDCDMKNAHPTILLKICKDKRWTTPCLERYVKERAKVLEEVGLHYNKSPADAKQTIAALMYLGGMPFKTSPDEEVYDFLTDLREEFKQIACNLKGAFEETYKFVSKRKSSEYDKLKSLVSFVLTNEEHKILMCINDYFENNGRNVDVLVYDGCLVRKLKGEEEMDSKILRACEKHIKKTQKYDIGLAVKPMESTLVLSDKGSEAAKDRKERKEKEGTEYDEGCYDKMKARFEAKCFKVKNPICYCEETSKGLVLKSGEKFRETYRDLYFKDRKMEKDEHGCPKYDGDGDEMYVQFDAKFIEKWFDDPKKRIYESMDCFPRPMECPEGMYNTWNGFAVERSYAPSSGKVQPFLDHLSIMVNHEETAVGYYLKWLASILQQPAFLHGTAPVHIGEQGGGKGVWYDLLMNALLGDDKYYSTCNPTKDLFDRFSNGRFGKFMINIDETKSKESYANSDSMKRAITEPTFNYEVKGLDPMRVSNYNHFAFTTNNPNPIKIEDTDRRYYVVNTSSEKIADKAYFDGFVAYVVNECNLKAIYDYLMNLDIAGVNWITDRPINETYKDIKALSVDCVYQMLINITRLIANCKGYEIAGGKFYEEVFTRWCENNRHGKKEGDEFRPPFSSKMFFMKLKNLMTTDKECGIQKKVCEGRMVYTLDRVKLEKFFKKRGMLDLEYHFSEDWFISLAGMF
jgi:hypothetical protein